jgi:hypothetical protein
MWICEGCMHESEETIRQHGSYVNEEHITKRPQTSQVEDELINAGFEYVRFDNRENVPIYRKRK